MYVYTELMWYKFPQILATEWRMRYAQRFMLTKKSLCKLIGVLKAHKYIRQMCKLMHSSSKRTHIVCCITSKCNVEQIQVVVCYRVHISGFRITSQTPPAGSLLIYCVLMEYVLYNFFNSMLNIMQFFLVN